MSSEINLMQYWWIQQQDILGSDYFKDVTHVILTCRGTRSLIAIERKRPRRDETWQWEVSDRIFGIKAERLGANWVLWSPSRVLIGPPLAGSRLSLASKTTFSRGCTAQFKASCCQLCECMNIHMHILAVLCLSFLFIPKFDTLEMHTKCMIHLNFSLQWFQDPTACTSLKLLWMFHKSTHLLN